MESSSKDNDTEAEPSTKNEAPAKESKLPRAIQTAFDAKYNIVDLQTPLNAFMSGQYKRSFAYHSLRNRLPVVLTNVIDTMTREKAELVALYASNEFEQAARDELKSIIGLISQLKYELQTDKAFHNFKGAEPDRDNWNNFLGDLPSGERTFYRGCSLNAECYLYRKLYSFVENSIFLKGYDYFAKIKEQALTDNMDDVLALIKYTRRFERSPKAFGELLKINLWSNCNDASNDPEAAAKMLNLKVLKDVEATKEYVLVDQAAEIWRCLDTANSKKPQQVDFVLDNAGYELFSDFILAEYMIEQRLATKVRFHVKAHPWFVTDVTEKDFKWTIEYLSQHADYIINLLGKKFMQFLDEGKFELAPTSHFWTSPHAFHRCDRWIKYSVLYLLPPYNFFSMTQTDPDLYSALQRSKLVVFKGELNYRKLLQDVCWASTLELSTCLRGFLPSNICVLRRVKSEIISGLGEGTAQALASKDPHWMVSGSYGLIQFVDGAREFGY
ncbi:hypothetical protein KR054_000925 [Drosophila jambulina]|nr:hypothetical protein KR054_000925 [Drosophila jambulina]